MHNPLSDGEPSKFAYKSGVGRVVGATERIGVVMDYALIRVDWCARVRSRFPREIGPINSEPYPTEKLIIVKNNRLEDRVEVQMCGARTKHNIGYASRRIPKDDEVGAYAPAYTPTNEQDRRLATPYIEIFPSFDKHMDFARRGDSGAVVLTANESANPDAQERPRPLGLLVAIDHSKLRSLGNIGYAIPIQRVLEEVEKVDGQAEVQGE
ncbi:MAG: hypothetical protein AAGI30_03155 [Planctomycetota bacterium]